MTRTISRRAFIGSAAAGTGAVLTGCVGQAGPSQQEGPKLTVAPLADAKGSITYWHQFNSEDERAGLAAVVSGFKTAAPNVTLTTETITPSDYMTKYTTAVQSKSVPDTCMTLALNAGDMIGLNGLQDLTSVVNSWAGKSDIDDSVWKPFIRSGKTWAIPTFMIVDWYYYRVDWLKSLGFSAPPATWEEFRTVSKAMTDSAQNRYGFAMRAGAGGGDYLMRAVRAVNGPFTDADGRPALSKDAVATALQAYSSLYVTDHSVPPSAPSDSYAQVLQSFTTGRAGMVMHHTGSLKSVRAALKPEVEFMTAPLPKMQNGQMGWLSPGAASLMKIDNAGASLAWLEYWGSANAQLSMFKSTGYWPTAKTAQASSELTADAILQGARDQIKVAQSPEFFAGMGGWSANSVLVQLQAVLVGKASVSEAADAIVSGFKSYFR